jgi:prepilin-type N-terminal cleavage/methylation domain-containing protein
MIISRAMRNLHRAQGGFTLIEVLVVMTILGILAAIVSISLLGVTGSAHDKGKKTEMKAVQTAWDAMLTDQQVATAALASACDNNFHNNMQGFPNGKLYDVAPKGSGTAQVTVLANHYLRQPVTAYGYKCDRIGDIFQSDAPMDKTQLH